VELRSAVEAAKASATQQLATDEKLTSLQQELAAAQGEIAAKQKEIDAAKTSREELELNYATLKHRIAELEQQVRTPKAVRPQRVLGNSSNVQQTPETPADGGSVARLKAASQASLAGLADPASSEARKANRASRDRSIAEQEKLMACVAEEIGFHKERPLAACIIFRSLLHWEAFNAERTNVFDRIINTMGGLLEKQQENNEVLGYWLSNTVTLLALFRHHIKPPSDSGYSRKRNSVSYGASLFGGFRNSSSFFSRGGSPAPNTPGSGVELASSNDERLVEAKYPALLFKQQLDAYVQKIFSLIRDNVKREIAVPLHNCSHAPPPPAAAVPGRPGVPPPRPPGAATGRTSWRSWISSCSR
jgi:myosin-5